MRFAAPHQSAQICDRHPAGDVPVDMIEHLSCLPCQQTLFSIFRGLHGLRINLLSQQRGCLEYHAVRGLFPVEMANGRIQQCHHSMHPVLSLHFGCLRSNNRISA